MAAVPEESAVERDVFPLECWSPCVGCVCGCSQALNGLCLNQLVLNVQPGWGQPKWKAVTDPILKM